MNYDHDEKKIIDSDAKLPFFKPLNFENLEVINTNQIEDDYAGEAVLKDSSQKALDEKLDFEALNKEAKEILDQARQEAMDLIDEANSQASQIKEDARNQGFEQGYNDGRSEVAKLQEDLKTQITENAREQQRIIQSIEPQYTNLVIKLLEKLTGIVSSEYKSVVLHLIQKAVEGNENDEQYCIRVSKEDYECVKNKIDSIKSLLKQDAIVEVVIDNKLEKSQCFIETDSSIIDCSLNVQLENLVTDIRSLAGK